MDPTAIRLRKVILYFGWDCVGCSRVNKLDGFDIPSLGVWRGRRFCGRHELCYLCETTAE